MRMLNVLLIICLLLLLVGCTQSEKELVRTEDIAIENKGIDNNK